MVLYLVTAITGHVALASSSRVRLKTPSREENPCNKNILLLRALGWLVTSTEIVGSWRTRSGEWFVQEAPVASGEEAEVFALLVRGLVPLS